MLGVEFLLAPRNGKVHGGAVGYFAVVVEKPDVAADEGTEAHEVLEKVGG